MLVAVRLLALASSLLVSFASHQRIAAATDGSGAIGADNTWTVGGSPYVFMGDVRDLVGIARRFSQSWGFALREQGGIVYLPLLDRRLPGGAGR